MKKVTLALTLINISFISNAETPENYTNRFYGYYNLGHTSVRNNSSTIHKPRIEIELNDKKNNFVYRLNAGYDKENKIESLANASIGYKLNNLFVTRLFYGSEKDTNASESGIILDFNSEASGLYGSMQISNKNLASVGRAKYFSALGGYGKKYNNLYLGGNFEFKKNDWGNYSELSTEELYISPQVKYFYNPNNSININFKTGKLSNLHEKQKSFDFKSIELGLSHVIKDGTVIDFGLAKESKNFDMQPKTNSNIISIKLTNHF